MNNINYMSLYWTHPPIDPNLAPSPSVVFPLSNHFPLSIPMTYLENAAQQQQINTLAVQALVTSPLLPTPCMPGHSTELPERSQVTIPVSSIVTSSSSKTRSFTSDLEKSQDIKNYAARVLSSEPEDMKKKTRRLNQNQACRNYRQRKKELHQILLQEHKAYVQSTQRVEASVAQYRQFNPKTKLQPVHPSSTMTPEDIAQTVETIVMEADYSQKQNEWEKKMLEGRIKVLEEENSRLHHLLKAKVKESPSSL